MKTSTKLIIIGLAILLIQPIVLGWIYKNKIKKNEYVITPAKEAGNMSGKLPDFKYIKIISNDKSIKFNINPADTLCYYTSSFNENNKVNVTTEMNNDTLLFNANLTNSNRSSKTIINIVTPDVQFIEANGIDLSVLAGDSNRVFNPLNLQALNNAEVEFEFQSITEERKRIRNPSVKKYDFIDLLIDENSAANISGSISIKKMNLVIRTTGKLNVAEDVTVDQLHTQFSNSARIVAPARFFKNNDLTNN